MSKTSICRVGTDYWVNSVNHRCSLPDLSSRGRKRHAWSPKVHLAVLLKKTTFLEIVPTYIKDCGFCCFHFTVTIQQVSKNMSKTCQKQRHISAILIDIQLLANVFTSVVFTTLNLFSNVISVFNSRLCEK